MWLAQIGSERIDETFDPSKADDLENALGESIITRKNNLNIKYIETTNK